MKKWISLWIFALLACLLLCGCQKAPEYVPPIPEEELRDLEAAYIQNFGKEIQWYNERTQMGNTVYCGSDNGYVILIDKTTKSSSGSGGQSSSTLQVFGGSSLYSRTFDEGVVFEPINSSTQFFAYKDGVFSDLKEIYQAGLISKEVMIEATQIYKNSTVTRWAD